MADGGVLQEQGDTADGGACVGGPCEIPTDSQVNVPFLSNGGIEAA